MTLKRLKKIIELKKSELQSQFNVSALYVFGSVAKNQANKKSDVDLLVEFSAQVDLFEFVNLKFYLESVLNVPIDLVTRDAIHKQMIQQIEKDIVRVA